MCLKFIPFKQQRALSHLLLVSDSGSLTSLKLCFSLVIQHHSTPNTLSTFITVCAIVSKLECKYLYDHSFTLHVHLSILCTSLTHLFKKKKKSYPSSLMLRLKPKD